MCVSEAPDEAAARVREFFARHPEIAPGDLDESFYVHRDREAVQHLFRVAASLDSMVVGEPQILGQVKQAYREATEHHATGPILNRLVHKAFSVAKRVRGETGIGDHAVSVSYAAVAMAKKIFGDLAGKNVLLLGAGEMAELALEHLKGQGAGQITVANRTLERGVAPGPAVRRRGRLPGRIAGAAPLRRHPHQLHRRRRPPPHPGPGQGGDAAAQAAAPVPHRHRGAPGPGPRPSTTWTTSTSTTSTT